jgi:hypothetical protein
MKHHLYFHCPITVGDDRDRVIVFPINRKTGYSVFAQKLTNKNRGNRKPTISFSWTTKEMEDHPTSFFPITRKQALKLIGKEALVYGENYVSNPSFGR